MPNLPGSNCRPSNDLRRRFTPRTRRGGSSFSAATAAAGRIVRTSAEDLAKSTLERTDFADLSHKRLKVLSLTDNAAAILAWANDEGFETVFVEQLKNLASADDMLLAFSGSGNSPNVLRAIEWANQARVRTWGITGFDGGKLRDIAQESLHVPLDDMGLVESFHLLLFHWILDDVHARIYSKGGTPRLPPDGPPAAKRRRERAARAEGRGQTRHALGAFGLLALIAKAGRIELASARGIVPEPPCAVASSLCAAASTPGRNAC